MGEAGLDGFRTEWSPTVADLLIDPAVSFALKDILRTWEIRDPVDAARDARLLAEVLERRADEAVSWIR
ncbi:hypothetical protein [Brevundimonas fontaquae]|uniref:Uncharacterized protein n=1 Tax=Brevundimonas fontaquae TaxID=2813778 RepID=A0ABX7LPU5_9CAUL|nr:hypothetical protein [Brevundimonas fontaquae]QSF54860.1 hypothetical protein JX001_03340 [Brevundimonas fontaquae]